ncbi:MAG: SufE family protein [Bacteroidota bacterium]|nr:SufE family protein [Bacteroidota bacterium]
MPDIATIQDEIVEEFEMLGDWQEKYEHIIALGKELKDFPEDQRIDANKVKGCQSSVWLISELKDGRIYYTVDSDALIVKGLASLVVRIFSARTPDEILEATPDFIGRIGLQSHLSPTRSNGLAAMVRQIKYYALAYKAGMQQNA